MIPIREQGPQRRDERQGLIEHHVVARLRNFDDRRGAAQEVEHVFADFGRHQHRTLAAEDADAALGRAQALRRIADRKTRPDRGIELPRPAAIDLLQRAPRDEVDDVTVVAWLFGREAESGEWGVAGGNGVGGCESMR